MLSKTKKNGKSKLQSELWLTWALHFWTTEKQQTSNEESKEKDGKNEDTGTSELAQNTNCSNSLPSYFMQKQLNVNDIYAKDFFSVVAKGDI